MPLRGTIALAFGLAASGCAARTPQATSDMQEFIGGEPGAYTVYELEGVCTAMTTLRKKPVAASRGDEDFSLETTHKLKLCLKNPRHIQFRYEF